MIFCLLEHCFCDNFFNIKNSTISFQSFFLYGSFFWRNSLIPLPIPQKFMVHHKARTRVCSIILPVFHHLYHVQPRKVYPKEASEMVAHEAHASWTGVDSLNIQHLALCRSLMLQARQLLKKKTKALAFNRRERTCWNDLCKSVLKFSWTHAQYVRKFGEQLHCIWTSNRYKNHIVHSD